MVVMQTWEYKVVPAPAKGTKAKGAKSAEARFALSVQNVLNEMAAEGWIYDRSDMLPSQERAGLTSSTTQWRNLLVFKRPLAQDDTPEIVGILEPPTVEDDPAPDAETVDEPADSTEQDAEKEISENQEDTSRN